MRWGWSGHSIFSYVVVCPNGKGGLWDGFISCILRDIVKRHICGEQIRFVQRKAEASATREGS